MRLLTSLIVATALFWSPAQANEREIAAVLSDEFFAAYLISGLTLPLIDNDSELGETRSLRAADALASSVIAVNAVKQLTDVARPWNDLSRHKDDSFPSGHTVAAFSVAAINAEFDPDSAPLWYGGAALIGASRVRLQRHHVTDVLAGAALGYGIAQLELGSTEGLLIAPFLDSDGVGLKLELSW